jgi:hypothetical protein
LFSEKLEISTRSKEMTCDDSGALMSNIEATQPRMLAHECAFADDARLTMLYVMKGCLMESLSRSPSDLSSI